MNKSGLVQCFCMRGIFRPALCSSFDKYLHCTAAKASLTNVVRNLRITSPIKALSGIIAILLLWSVTAAVPSPALAKSGLVERGTASWYGPNFHGRRTANGEIFNTHDLSAAHKSLPFGVVLRVKNLKNGQSVLVRINDRGPYIHKRTLDLSHRAGNALRMLHSGVAPVIYEVISDRKGVPLNPANAFFVLLQREKDESKVESLSVTLEKKLGRDVKILSTESGGKSGNALCIGPFNNFKAAQKEFLRCEKEGITARSIVEAPANGSELPLYAVPNILKRKTVEKDLETAKNFLKTAESGQNPAAGAVAHPLGTTLQGLWAQTFEQSAYFLDITVNAISGITSSHNIFRLHYFMLSGYLDLSS